MLVSVRRAAAAIAAPALVLGAVAAGSAPASAAVPSPAVASGGSWLADQLVDGLLTYDYGGPYTDLGSTIDAGLALHELGAEPTAVTDIVAAMKDKAVAYTRPGDANPSGTTLVSAGATAKTLVLAEETDPSSAGDFGGVDLVSQLEDTLNSTPPNRGRIEDDWQETESWSADYANVIGQALAVRGLAAADSPRTGDAVDFLLHQQCTAGFFREYFAPRDAVDQSCDGGNGEPSVDTTAQAILALAPLNADTDIAAAVTKAGTWLAGYQLADGSFTSGAGEFAQPANGNSTGLAARALAAAGQTAAATKAATWIRAHQATDVGACAPYAAADLGAIAYDNTGLAAARTAPIDSVDVGEWIRTTVQALPALALAPLASGSPRVTGPTGYVHGGSTISLRLSGLTPGAPACLTGGSGPATLAGVAGTVTRALAMPKATATRSFVLTTPGGSAKATVKVLGAKRLKTTVRKGRIHQRGRQVVRVTGLAPSETVTVRLNGKRVASGHATARGVYTRTVKVTGKPGKRTVVVRGQFADRTGRVAFKVVR